MSANVERIMNIKVAVTILSLACASTLLAQPAAEKKNDSPGERRPERFQGPGGYGPRMDGGFERVFGILTEEQRGSFRAAMEGQRDRVRELEQKSAEARQELMEAALVDKFDEGKVRGKLNALMKVDADLTMIRIKGLSKIEPALTAEQLQKLRDVAQGERRGAPEPSKRRPEAPRDENGLPLKR